MAGRMQFDFLGVNGMDVDVQHAQYMYLVAHPGALKRTFEILKFIFCPHPLFDWLHATLDATRAAVVPRFIISPSARDTVAVGGTDVLTEEHFRAVFAAPAAFVDIAMPVATCVPFHVRGVTLVVDEYATLNDFGATEAHDTVVVNVTPPSIVREPTCVVDTPPAAFVWVVEDKDLLATAETKLAEWMSENEGRNTTLCVLPSVVYDYVRRARIAACTTMYAPDACTPALALKLNACARATMEVRKAVNNDMCAALTRHETGAVAALGSARACAHAITLELAACVERKWPEVKARCFIDSDQLRNWHTFIMSMHVEMGTDIRSAVNAIAFSAVASLISDALCNVDAANMDMVYILAFRVYKHVVPPSEFARYLDAWGLTATVASLHAVTPHTASVGFIRNVLVPLYDDVVAEAAANWEVGSVLRAIRTVHADAMKLPP